MKHIVIIDGQGGKLGRLLVEKVKAVSPAWHVTAIGTNATATAAMLKAGADDGATGENPVRVACRGADVIAGPLGIVIADSLLGEVTPAMALAVGRSPAVKVLLPVNRCRNLVVGVADAPVSELIRQAVEQIAAACR